MVTLPAPRSEYDPYGFEFPPNFDLESYDAQLSEYLGVLARRTRKWHRVFFRNPARPLRRSSRLKRYVRKGIPAEFRGKVWAQVSGAAALQTDNPGLYKSLLRRKADQTLIEVIRLDIPRTFPDNIYFKDESDGQLKSLFNVLIAFAQYNSSIGYCQGLNYIAGILLIVSKHEETAFWLLVVLIGKILPGYYTKDMKALLVDLDVLETLVQMKMPHVYYHMKYVGVTWPLIATKWLICLYAEVLPTETVLRIWDCLFYDGSKILFRVALTLVKMNSINILSCADCIEVAECFKQMMRENAVLDCHGFLQKVFKDPGRLRTSMISELRRQATLNHA